MRVMLVSVGTGESVEEGIAFSVTSANPDRVCFICSTDSKAKVPAILELLQGRGLEGAIEGESFVISDPGNFDTTYAKCHEVLSRLGAWGHSREDLTIDYTSGTKVMAAALVAAGRDWGVGRYVYIAGSQRAGPGMRVVSSTEEFRQTRAGAMNARGDLGLAVGLLNRCQWAATVELAEAAEQKCRAGAVADQAQAVAALARCYQAWDQFVHAQAWELMGEIDKSAEALLGVALSGNKSLLGRLKDGAPTPAGEYGLALLADLLNNAERRAECGQYEDAVARLYRATELMGQMRLAELEPPLCSSRVPMKRVPEELHDKWHDRADKGGCVQLSLHMNYELLAALRDELGEWFLKNNRLRDALKTRNEAILAHGFRPASAEDFEVLSEEVSARAAKIDSRVDEWRAAGRFVRCSFSDPQRRPPEGALQ